MQATININNMELVKYLIPTEENEHGCDLDFRRGRKQTNIKTNKQNKQTNDAATKNINDMELAKYLTPTGI